GPNENLRIRVLDILGRDPTKLEVPLLVQGLGVETAENDYGFTFTKTAQTQAIEAPFLTKDQRVRYDTETRTLVHAESEDEGIHIWTPADQSGLRRAYRYRFDDLYFWNDLLLYSLSDGRVQFFEDPQGRAENLDVLLKQTQAETERMSKRNELLARAKSLLEEARNV
ncbi:MAG: hypothetical protein ABIB47_06880, partial [Candidatus Woesearchaeota archaeon]